MAHVVDCELLEVDRHIYRVRKSIGISPVQHHEAESMGSDWEEAEQADYEEDIIDESLITQQGDKFVTSVDVDPEVLPFVIGKGGSKLKEITAATGASLHIPKLSQQRSAEQHHNASDPEASTGLLRNSRSETITIKASSKQSLSSARTRVELQIKSAISSRLLDYTHFISLPLSNEHTAAKLQAFQDQVLSQPGAKEKGFDRSIFCSPQTLHLTLLMLKLYSDADRHKAVQTLHSMQQRVHELLAGEPLKLQLAGLDHMSDDPTDMHVLYLRVVDLLGTQQRLQQLCELVVAKFKEAGLLQPGQYETVKLHCTVINTRYRRGEQQQVLPRGSGRGEGRGGRGPGRVAAAERIGFDGRDLLQDWEDKLDLGEYVVPAVHLSQRGAFAPNAMASKRQFLVPVGDIRPAEGDRPSASKIYRNYVAEKGFPEIEAKTLYELFQISASKYSGEKCLGWRPVDGATGKAGEYQWMTYAEANEKVQALASGLAGLGLTAQNRVGVYGMNCPEWMIAMQACNRMSYHCVPLYDTLGENAVEYIINHSEAVAAFCDSKKLSQLAKAAATEGFKHVIYWGEGDAAAIEVLKGHNIVIHSFDDLMSAGKAKPVDPVPPAAEDYCTIMYTSGTTGDPKGVLLKHSAVVATVASLVSFLKDVCSQELGVGDVTLSYLPLAHIFDRTLEEMFLAVGGAIGYWQGNTNLLVDDIGALKPTIFVGVPRVFDRIYSRITDQINEAGGVKKLLFNWGFARKLYYLQRGVAYDKAAPFFDRLVFSKVKARLGGRVRLIVSGGAPLAPHVEEFLKVAMCAPVCQGYGLTETCAGSCIAVPDNWDMHGTNGPCTPCTELRLESVPEMNYDATQEDEPAGEVLIRGPQLFSGYYKAADKTAEVLDADGWFHTGDIGRITAAGGLKIVDRKKNIFKLSQGEYIAVEKLEAIYKKSPAVEQVWVYGNSFKNCLVAVVVPKEDAIRAWAESKGKTGSISELCQDPAAVSWMLDDLKSVGKENKTKGFEAIKALILEPEQFSVENDCLTPTFKFKRPQLQKRYQAQIDAMYNKLETA